MQVMTKTPCQLMAEQALDDHVQHYHFVASIGTTNDIKYLDNYKGKKGFFIKKFLISDKFNLNRWRVTWEGIKRDIWGFIGKPLVLTPALDHPSVADQEDYRVGNIIDVGLDEVNKIAWQVSEVFDKKTQDKILAGEAEYGSPTVMSYSKETTEIKFAGTDLEEHTLHRFIPAHDAIVSDPAYHKGVDKISAVCTGDPKGCALKLLTVQASVEYRNRYEGKNPQVYDPEDVGFVHSKTPKQCGTCVKFSKPNICNLPLSIPVDPVEDCCNNWKENKNYKADVNQDNTNQLTIVHFVQNAIKKRFSAQELANIIGHIKQAEEGADQSCVSRKIKILANEHKDWSHDKIIAVAYSYCGEKGEMDARFESKIILSLADDLLKYAH